MLELEEALPRILALMPAARREIVPLADARGRVCFAPVTAPIALPPFDNSAMDGYAVRAADVAGATAENPKHLRLIGRTAAGTACMSCTETSACSTRTFAKAA